MGVGCFSVMFSCICPCFSKFQHLCQTCHRWTLLWFYRRCCLPYVGTVGGDGSGSLWIWRDHGFPIHSSIWLMASSSFHCWKIKMLLSKIHIKRCSMSIIMNTGIVPLSLENFEPEKDLYAVAEKTTKTWRWQIRFCFDGKDMRP